MAAETEKSPALTALGRQIRKVREAKGFSQEDFAAQAGLGRSYYGGIERGERNVAALNLMKIAAALKVEVGDLFPLSVVFQPLLVEDAASDATP
jgi:transcriptional regulator with XRE-family HTH domain